MLDAGSRQSWKSKAGRGEDGIMKGLVCGIWQDVHVVDMTCKDKWEDSGLEEAQQERCVR